MLMVGEDASCRQSILIAHLIQKVIHHIPSQGTRDSRLPPDAALLAADDENHAKAKFRRYVEVCSRRGTRGAGGAPQKLSVKTLLGAVSLKEGVTAQHHVERGLLSRLLAPWPRLQFI